MRSSELLPGLWYADTFSCVSVDTEDIASNKADIDIFANFWDPNSIWTISLIFTN